MPSFSWCHINNKILKPFRYKKDGSFDCGDAGTFSICNYDMMVIVMVTAHCLSYDLGKFFDCGIHNLINAKEQAEKQLLHSNGGDFAPVGMSIQKICTSLIFSAKEFLSYHH